MNRRIAGKVLISTVALAAPVGAVTAEWNDTHIYNPKWTPHAKFHTGQTLAFAVELAALSLWQLWRPSRQPRAALRWGTLLAGFYWAAQAPAILVPGTALVDPEFADQVPRVAGVPADQRVGQVAVLGLLAAGYTLARRTAGRDRSR